MILQIQPTMVKKRASKYGHSQTVLKAKERLIRDTAAETRRAAATSSPSAVPTARDVHQRIKRLRDSPSGTWLSPLQFVCFPGPATSKLSKRTRDHYCMRESVL